MSDLTEVTKLTTGSIYGNFQNKEEVALAAFDHNLAKLRGTIESAVAPCKTTKEKLIMSVMVYHSSQKKRFPEGGCPMQNTLTDADDTHEDLRKRAAAGLMLWKNDLVTLMKQGIKEKVFDAKTDVDKTAMHIIALIEFGFLTHSATNSRKQVDALVEMAREVVDNICI